MKILCGIRETPAPIPVAVLEAARLRLKRQIAAAFIEEMAETGISFEEMDGTIGANPGHSRRWLIQMIDGRANDLDPVSDLFLALRCEPSLALRSTERVGTLADATPTHHPSATEGGEHG
jgi:hypothetical protein